MRRLSFIEALRYCMAAAKNFSAELVGAVFNTVQEMEDTKSDKGESVPVVIPASGWMLPEGQETPAAPETYPYYFDIRAKGVTALDRASVTFSVTSLSEVDRCGLCQTYETKNGVIRLWSASKPESDITVEYWIEQGVSPEERKE